MLVTVAAVIWVIVTLVLMLFTHIKHKNTMKTIGIMFEIHYMNNNELVDVEEFLRKKKRFIKKIYFDEAMQNANIRRIKLDLIIERRRRKRDE